MTTEDSPILVQEESTGDFGLYYPDEGFVETYVGDEREEIPGAYVGENWHEADEDDLRASIESEIETVREQIDELRSRGLSDEQEREIERLESRLESQENVLELAEEVGDE